MKTIDITFKVKTIENKDEKLFKMFNEAGNAEVSDTTADATKSVSLEPKNSNQKLKHKWCCLSLLLNQSIMSFLILLLGIILLVVLITWAKLNAFLAFIIVSILIGLFNGMSMPDVTAAMEKGIGDIL